MSKKAIVTVASVIGLLAAGQSAAAEWHEYNGHWYRLTSAVMWDEARDEALRAAGDLVIIDDSDENAWLVTTFGGQDETTSLWIGFTDADVEGTWTWVGDSDLCSWPSGNPSICYTNWAPNEPSNSGPNSNEDHAMIYVATPSEPEVAGKWNDGDDTINPVLPETYSIIGGIIERTTDPSIPAVSKWGLVAMVLLLIAAGTLVLRRPQAARC